jgi:hypothetical protein
MRLRQVENGKLSGLSGGECAGVFYFVQCHPAWTKYQKDTSV